MGFLLKVAGAVLVGRIVEAKIYFSETFDAGWESRWTLSKWKESEGTAGTFKLNAGKWFSDAEAEMEEVTDPVVAQVKVDDHH
jgi:hypothetical protein